MTDESGIDVALHIDTLLDNATGPDGYYGVFTANMHTDTDDNPGADAIVAAAHVARRARGLGDADARPGSTGATARRSPG